MKKYQAAAAMIVAATLGLGLGGCTKDDNASGATVLTPDASASASQEQLAQAADGSQVRTVVVEETGLHDVPALVDGGAPIAADVKRESCQGGPGQVEAAGTVINRADEPRDIVVSVRWLSPDDGETVLANSSAVLKQVAAGATEGYRITNNVETADGAAAMCSLTALSGSLES